MTLVEFIAPLLKGTNQDRILGVLYYRERYDEKKSLTTDEIRKSLKNGKVKNWAKLNVPDVLAKSGALTQEGELVGKRHSYALTDSGKRYVRSQLGLPEADVEIEHEAGSLEELVKKVRDTEVRGYLEEAIKCLQVGALRACVVFTWVAAIRTIHVEMMKKGGPAVTSAVQTHFQKAHSVNAIEDFAHIKESITLLAAKDLGLLDKNEKDTLTDALNLRNKCGHPSRYRPGIKKVAAFIEDLVAVVFK